MARSHWPECHSVCFPNMNLGVRGADGSYSGSSRCVLAVRLHTDAHGTAPKMFKIMWRTCVFGKCSISILGAYGMYGKRSGSMRLTLGAFK